MIKRKEAYHWSACGLKSSWWMTLVRLWCRSLSISLCLSLSNNNCSFVFCLSLIIKHLFVHSFVFSLSLSLSNNKKNCSSVCFLTLIIKHLFIHSFILSLSLSLSLSPALPEKSRQVKSKCWFIWSRLVQQGEGWAEQTSSPEQLNRSTNHITCSKLGGGGHNSFIHSLQSSNKHLSLIHIWRCRRWP